MKPNDLKCGDTVLCNTIMQGDVIGQITSKHTTGCDISCKNMKLLAFPYDFIDGKLNPEEEFAWHMES